MNVTPYKLPGLLLIEPRVFHDQRGQFCETFQAQRYRDIGIAEEFVQDNYSRSCRGTLRGLHYQLPHPQGKLVWALSGEVYDVVVDLRRSSPTFKQWVGVRLSEKSLQQLYVPPGFAHGFYVLSGAADVFYKCTDKYYPAGEQTLRWDDPELAITWPDPNPLVSQKDSQGSLLSELPYFD
ncbi:MAG: dTDP-4-dehydrorhamnose 3,5-epimerase [Pirellulaceae bacterium]|nr:dTDP-4-dehydrorhamnose 3,5-epimerase [Planctomycetales bacterium]